MDIVEVGKNDVSNFIRGFTGWLQLIILIPDIVIQSGEGLIASLKPLAEALLVEREGNKVLCNSKVIRMRCQKNNRIRNAKTAIISQIPTSKNYINIRPSCPVKSLPSVLRKWHKPKSSSLVLFSYIPSTTTTPSHYTIPQTLPKEGVGDILRPLSSCIPIIGLGASGYSFFGSCFLTFVSAASWLSRRSAMPLFEAAACASGSCGFEVVCGVGMGFWS